MMVTPWVFLGGLVWRLTSMIVSYSTTANSGHDFDFVAVRERMRIQSAARHDLAIAFESDTLAGQAERHHQIRAGKRMLELADIAIYGYGNQGCIYTGKNHRTIEPSNHRTIAQRR
jgi:hypothetical protein